MDCGSIFNVMSYKEYCKIAQDGDAKLQKTHTKFRLYDGLVILPLGITLTEHSSGHIIQFQPLRKFCHASLMQKSSLCSMLTRDFGK